MTVTYSPKPMESFFYKNKTVTPKEVPTRFFRISVNCFPRIPIEEASDLELLTLSEKMGTFSFLADQEEDIYSISDGDPVDD